MILDVACKVGMHLKHEYDMFYARTLRNIDQTESEQLTRAYLVKLIRHAHSNNDYYRRIIDEADVDPNDFGPEDLAKLPILTKDDIRKNFSSMLSKDYLQRRPYENFSGGSTGEPVRLMQDYQYKTRSRASFQYYYRHFVGIDEMAAKKIVLWGSERDIFREKEKSGVKLYNRLSRTTVLNSFRMTKDNMGQYVDQINRVRPELIRAYAGSIYELSRYVNESRLKVHMPKAIVSAAETLRPFMREEIQKAFPTPIFNYYGSREVGGMAGECEHHKMHVLPLENYIEVLDAKGNPVAPGEEGRVVVTNLHNYSMPLIRFEIGDTATVGGKGCNCGHFFPYLENVTGRVTDHFRLTNGTMVHGEYFTHLFYFRDWVYSFQVIQEDYATVRVKVIKRSEPPAKDLVDIEKKIRLVMGDKCSITWDFVDKIETTRTGKHLYTKTLVKA